MEIGRIIAHFGAENIRENDIYMVWSACNFQILAAVQEEIEQNRTIYYYNANTYKKYNFCLFPNCNENVTLL